MRLAFVFCGLAALAQEKVLTLSEAEAIAVRNHPRIKAAQLEATAAAEQANQARAALRPTLTWNTVGSIADHESRWGASGNINPSGLFSRTATGININQNLFDFGRTSASVRAAQLRASALDGTATASRALVILLVRQAYFRGLLAAAAHGVAVQTLESRRLVLKQISALVASNLRSTLDQGFAEVAVSEAELALLEAENMRRFAMVELAAALGTTGDAPFSLEEQPMPPDLGSGVDVLVREALGGRPEITAARRRLEAARAAAEIESRQQLPSLTAIGAGGFFGPRDPRLHPHYGVVGVNLQVPVLNGGIFRSRRREADLRAEAQEGELRAFEVDVARDVKNAWLSVDNSSRRLQQTAKLVEQAARTLRLATSRYDLGLGSIVELNQAQLSVAAAETAAASARYEYQIRRVNLDFEVGRLQ